MPRIPALFTLVAAINPLFPAVCRAQVRDSASVVTTIRQLERDWAAALIIPDTARLQQIVSSQFALMPSTTAAELVTRARWFANLAQNPYKTFTIRESVVRVFARRPPWHRWSDMAIASFLTDQRTVSKGRERTETVFITDVWRIEGKQWRAVARYATQPEVSASTRAAR